MPNIYLRRGTMVVSPFYVAYHKRRREDDYKKNQFDLGVKIRIISIAFVEYDYSWGDE